MKERLNITVNGEELELDVNPGLTLLEFLREELNLSGVKKGCGEGECGACTVIMNGKAIDSCLTPVMKAMNADIQTIEGLSGGEVLHPIQQSFIDKGAVQCGFCTPGMIMSAKALIDENPDPSKDEVKEALSGNLCRCTGYVKIEEAVLAAAEMMRKGER